MLPIKLSIPDSFLEEEVRNGYCVSREMKELWAVILDLLNELLDCCRKTGVTAFAAYGTLIGAVRHNGFIPWDDDLDLFMLREDYDRFIQNAHFDHPYFLQTEYTDIGFGRTFARLRNSETTAIQTYEKDMKIPYNQGIFIDIFPLDYMPEDPTGRARLSADVRGLRSKAIQWSSNTFKAPGGPGMKNTAKRMISSVSSPVLKTLKVSNPFIRKMDQLARSQTPGEKVGDLWFYNPEKDNYYFRSDFENTELHPFEMVSIPIPTGYDRILTAEFGDWRTPVMAANDHGELIIDAHKPYTQYGR